MKKGAFAILLLTAVVIFASSCSKVNTDQPGFPGLRCAVNNATEYIAEIDSAFYTRGLGTTVRAGSGKNTRIIIYMGLDTIGTIGLAQTGSNVAYYLDGVNTYVSTSGTVNVTQYFNDSLRVMNGNFNFKGRVANDTTKTISIDYGYFNGIPRH